MRQQKTWTITFSSLRNIHCLACFSARPGSSSFPSLVYLNLFSVKEGMSYPQRKIGSSAAGADPAPSVPRAARRTAARPPGTATDRPDPARVPEVRSPRGRSGPPGSEDAGASGTQSPPGARATGPHEADPARRRSPDGAETHRPAPPWVARLCRASSLRFGADSGRLPARPPRGRGGQPRLRETYGGPGLVRLTPRGPSGGPRREQPSPSTSQGLLPVSGE